MQMTAPLEWCESNGIIQHCVRVTALGDWAGLDFAPNHVYIVLFIRKGWDPGDFIIQSIRQGWIRYKRRAKLPLFQLEGIKYRVSNHTCLWSGRKLGKGIVLIDHSVWKRSKSQQSGVDEKQRCALET